MEIRDADPDYFQPPNPDELRRIPAGKYRWNKKEIRVADPNPDYFQPPDPVKLCRILREIRMEQSRNQGCICGTRFFTASGSG